MAQSEHGDFNPASELKMDWWGKFMDVIGL